MKTVSTLLLAAVALAALSVEQTDALRAHTHLTPAEAAKIKHQIGRNREKNPVGTYDLHAKNIHPVHDVKKDAHHVAPHHPEHKVEAKHEHAKVVVPKKAAEKIVAMKKAVHKVEAPKKAVDHKEAAPKKEAEKKPEHHAEVAKKPIHKAEVAKKPVAPKHAEPKKEQHAAPHKPVAQVKAADKHAVVHKPVVETKHEAKKIEVKVSLPKKGKPQVVVPKHQVAVVKKPVAPAFHDVEHGKKPVAPAFREHAKKPTAPSFHDVKHADKKPQAPAFHKESAKKPVAPAFHRESAKKPAAKKAVTVQLNKKPQLQRKKAVVVKEFEWASDAGSDEASGSGDFESGLGSGSFGWSSGDDETDEDPVNNYGDFGTFGEDEFGISDFTEAGSDDSASGSADGLDEEGEGSGEASGSGPIGNVNGFDVDDLDSIDIKRAKGVVSVGMDKKKPVAKKVESVKKVEAKPVAKAVVAKKAEAVKKVAAKPVAKKVEAKSVVKKVVAKPVAKKVESKPVVKKVEIKKAEVKKVEIKKPVAKKVVAKKVEAKKMVAKKVEAKKVEEKKAVAKKVEAKKPVAKKVEAKPVAKMEVHVPKKVTKPVAKKTEHKKADHKKVDHMKADHKKVDHKKKVDAKKEIVSLNDRLRKVKPTTVKQKYDTVEDQAQKTGAEVATHVSADSSPFGIGSSKTVLMVASVAGAVVGIIGVIMALVHFRRQQSDDSFGPLALESDLPEPQTARDAPSPVDEEATEDAQASSDLELDDGEEERKEEDAVAAEEEEGEFANDVRV